MRATAVTSQVLCGRYCELCSMECSSFPIFDGTAVLTSSVVRLNRLQSYLVEYQQMINRSVGKVIVV
jgi:hypothetical protein